MIRTHQITFLVIIISVLLACSGSNNNDKQNKVKVATLRGPSAISMVKLFEDSSTIANKEVEYEIKNEPLQIRPLLFQEKTEFAVVPTNMAAILYNKNVPYQLAATPVWGTLYLFGEDTTITTWSDLNGETIHLMAKGMTPDVMFRYLLEKHGIDPSKDVTLDYSFPTHIELANAVASGKAKLGVISEPLVSMVMKRNKGVKPVLSLNKEWKQLTGLEIPQTALLVHKDFASQNPEFMEKFMEAYKNSVDWVNTNHNEAAKLIVKHKILNDEEVAKNSIPRCNLNFKKAYNNKSLINDYLGIFYTMNPDIIGGKIPDENFYYKK